MAHGCKAGLGEHAFSEVYVRRVLRGTAFYTTTQLGGFSAQITALSHFFERGDWEQPIPGLAEETQAFILKQMAEMLCGLNRANEADRLYRLAIDKLRRLGTGV